MYFLDALRVLRRRWIVMLVGLVLVAASAVAVVRVVPTQYQATGQLLLLLPPRATGNETPTNPYLNMPGEMTTLASLLASGQMTKDSERELAAGGFDSEYDVAVVPGAGPLLIVTTKDTDEAAVLATRDEVMERLEEDLDAIQSEVGAPDRQRITLRPFAVSGQAEALPGSKIRALAVVGGGGVTLTLLCAFLLDRRRRPRPRHGLKEVSGTGGVPGPGEARARARPR